MGTFVTLDNEYITLVDESSAVAGLEDGVIYALSAQTYVSVVSLMSGIKDNLDLSRLAYQYDVRRWGLPSWITNGSKLSETIKEGYGLVLPISTPDKIEKVYLLARAKNDAWEGILPAVIVTAENLTKQSAMNALANLAVQEPESCKGALDDFFREWVLPQEPEQALEKNLVSLMAHKAFADTSGMAMAPVQGPALSAEQVETSYQQTKEMLGRFVDNCITLKKLKKKSSFTPKQQMLLHKAQVEVNYVFSILSPQILSDFALQMMRKNDIALAYDNCINRERIAELSRLTVSVEAPKPEIDARVDPKVLKKMKTNGKFRVYLSNGVDLVQVKFSRRSSCIVYIIYLLDRKRRGDDIDTLKLSEQSGLFCELYSLVYNPSGARKAFSSLITTFEDGEPKRSRLSDCYLDIREALSSAVSSFGESPLPFYIPNERSHITVLDERITVPEPFKQLASEAKNESARILKD